MASLPTAAGAVDVNLGAMVDAVYDSNIYRTSQNQKQDGSFRFTPTIEIALPGRKFSADVYYAPTYEVFTTYSDANDLTHFVRNTIDWLPTEKTTVRLYNRFEAVDVLNFGDPANNPPGTAPDNDIERERLHIFGSALSVAHAISPRWSSTTNVNFDLFNSEEDTTVDSKSIAAFQEFQYGLTASDRVGGGFGGNFQFFEDTPLLPKSQTFVYNIFASYSRDFGERTTVTLRVGPALIQTMQDTIDNSQTVPEYPHIALDSNVTQVSDISVDPDFKIKDRDGAVLDGSEAVPLGSVLVPRASACAPDSGDPGLYDPTKASCAADTLLRNDAGHPFEQAAIAAIANNSITISGSNSGADDLAFTIFAEAAVSHLWAPNLSSTLSYNRRESPARGQGAGTVADSVLFQTDWQPTELWDLSLRGSYVHQDTPNNLSSTFGQIELDSGLAPFDLVVRNGKTTVVEVSNSVATHRWGVTLRAARRITRRISASARLAYADQRSKHTSTYANDFGHFLAIVGVKYDFDPFRF